MDSYTTEASVLPFPHLSLGYLPCCMSLGAASLHSPALLGLHRAAPLAVAPTGAIAHSMPGSSYASTSQL